MYVVNDMIELRGIDSRGLLVTISATFDLNMWKVEGVRRPTFRWSAQWKTLYSPCGLFLRGLWKEYEAGLGKSQSILSIDCRKKRRLGQIDNC